MREHLLLQHEALLLGFNIGFTTMMSDVLLSSEAFEPVESFVKLVVDTL